ncbi:MAG: hypothetical protein ACK4E8_04165 [Lacibacter sp.]|jgi:hypothetical protein
MIGDQQLFSTLANDLYLNFWNDKIHPIISDFVEAEAPWIMSKAKTEWTAYSSEPSSALTEEIIRSEYFFDKHPYFEGPYHQSSFAMDLRKKEGKTIGVISVSVCFLFLDKVSCIHTFNLLCNKFRALVIDKERKINETWVSFSNPNNSWPFEVQIKLNRQENRSFPYAITFFQGQL